MTRIASSAAAALLTTTLSAAVGIAAAQAQAVDTTAVQAAPANPTTNAAPVSVGATTSVNPTPPAPDKDTYTLFNPTPDAQERSFSTDRPDKSNSPYTVDAGHFQYETDLFNWTGDYNAPGHVQSREIITADPVLKMGLTNNIDFEVGLGGYQNLRVATPGQKAVTYSGYGDTYFRTKINLWGNDSGTTAFALIPYIKAPTAGTGLGNGEVEGGVIAPLSITLPYNFTAILETELDALKNADDDGHHVSFTNLINISYPLTSKLTAAGEFFSQVQEGADNLNVFTFDASLAYMIGPNTQVDIAGYAGLNRAAPDAVAYMGLSQRF